MTWALTLVFIGGAERCYVSIAHLVARRDEEGPTPVSALIHAATMVVAGVYLVARLFPVFHINGASLHVVTWVGAFPLSLAAVIAYSTDIKRVLAYSTMSQIGYMMFALGVSGYSGEGAPALLLRCSTCLLMLSLNPSYSCVRGPSFMLCVATK